MFIHPWFMVAGGAAVSAPIVIHLINRMRFKRIRWAAMEFLLKSQKRNRRRLIIEQLLLLALRCLLVVLAGLLVARLSAGIFTPQTTLHVVLLSDNLSMNDHWNDGAADSFQEACRAVKEIAKKAAQASSAQRLIVLRLSQCDPARPVPVFDERLNEETRRKLDGLFPDDGEKQQRSTLLSVKPIEGVLAAKKIMADNAAEKHILHIVGDFRASAWGGAEKENKLLQEIDSLRAKNATIHLVDVAHPARSGRQEPGYHGNLAILDLRPETSVSLRDKSVEFKVKVANYSEVARTARLKVTIKDGAKVEEHRRASQPLTLATGVKEFKFPVTFVETGLNMVVAELENQDTNSGLREDNYRCAVVEVRDEMPVLLIDGNSPDGKQESNDRRHLATLLGQQSGVRVEMGTLADLENGFHITPLQDGQQQRHGLLDYPSIYLLNVRSIGSRSLLSKQSVQKLADKGVPQSVLAKVEPLVGKTFESEKDLLKELTDRLKPGELKLKPDEVEHYRDRVLNQANVALTNLQDYVESGRNVAFFLGPQVDHEFYNRAFYQDGAGLFPAPLAAQPLRTTPGDRNRPMTEKDREILMSNNEFKVMLRNPEHPILKDIGGNRDYWEYFKFVIIEQYYPIQSFYKGARYVRGEGVEELLTLPNQESVEPFKETAQKLVGELVQVATDNPACKKYRELLLSHQRTVRQALQKNAYQLGSALNGLLNDRADPNDPKKPNLAEFWALSDHQIVVLRREINDLRERVEYGAPLMMTKTYGRGKTVAVMTTAGTSWNRWGGGNKLAMWSYGMVMLSMQSYLGTVSESSSRTLGEALSFTKEAGRFKPTMFAYFRSIRKEEKGPAARPAAGEQKDAETPAFTITDKTLETLRTLGVAESALSRLQPLINKSFDQRERLATELSQLLAKEDLARYRNLILEQADQAWQYLGNYPGTVVQNPTPGAKKELAFHFKKTETHRPGVYRFHFAPLDGKQALKQEAHAFNVDAAAESNLARAPYEKLVRPASLAQAGLGPIYLNDEDPDTASADFSRSPWFFLFLLLVLVAEQALAVHLSFHLHGSEAHVLEQVVKPRATAA